MKFAVKIAWGLGAPIALAVLLFFFLIAPARAPSGGKLWTGGRTIASLQEEDFDRRLLKMQLCYGVRVVADQCTLERRRVCKALVVHEMSPVFEKAGSFLGMPVEFHCEDTAVGKVLRDDESTVSLRPNGEVSAILGAIGSHTRHSGLTALQSMEAETACEFLTDCKWAMRPKSFSLRKIFSCLGTPNAAHRKILMNEVGGMLFGGKASRRSSLYANFVEMAGK
ncbi:MAG TPA: hypothetical protein VIH99_05205 [Bdellovibrionota bacterium]|jgi:hypothetical protein